MATELKLAEPAANAKEKGRAYRFPPGLQHNLVWYVFRKFRPLDPIDLFQYLAKEFSDIAHYKIGPQHIVFLNNLLGDLVSRGFSRTTRGV